MDITAKGVPTGLKRTKFGHLLVQQWLTGHNRLGVTEFRAFVVQRRRTGHDNKKGVLTRLGVV